MRIVGQNVLDNFRKKHSDARSWINRWVTVVNASTWTSIEDVRQSYASADGVKLKSGNVVTVFNCKGNDYRLLTYVAYAVQTMQVLEVMSHAEYSRNSWKERY